MNTNTDTTDPRIAVLVEPHRAGIEKFRAAAAIRAAAFTVRNAEASCEMRDLADRLDAEGDEILRGVMLEAIELGIDPDLLEDLLD